MRREYIILVIVLALLGAGSTVRAVELVGAVQAVRGERITLTIDPDLLPNPGDKVEVFNEIPGLGQVALDCQWQVEEVRDNLVVAATKDKSRATAQQGYKAVIYSPHPRSTRPPEQPEEQEKDEPVEKEPVPEQPPSGTKGPKKDEPPGEMEPPVQGDDALNSSVPPGKGPQQPPAPVVPGLVTAESLQAKEPWVVDWTAHDILIDFPGGGKSGLYLDPVPSGQAHPSPGRRGILYVHPAGASEAAKISHPVTLQGPAPVLQVGVCANRDPDGDFLLVVTVDGARWGAAKRVAGADGWLDLAYDLSPFTGRTATVQLEVHSNDWQREYAFFDYIRIEDKPAPPPAETAPEQASEPEPKPAEQVVSVSRIVFSDDFNGENEGEGQLNHSRFDNWLVRSGEADLLGRGLGGTHGDHGLYVELHGSGYLPGKLQSRRAFRLDPGTYLLEFDVAASPKGAKSNLNVALGKLYEETFALEGKKPFETISRRVDVAQATNASLVFRLKSRGEAGPLLDNVRIAAVSYGTAQTRPPSAQSQVQPLKSASPYLGVRVATHESGTARVVEVAAESPAARAGLLPGDIVLKIDDVSLGQESVGAAGFIRVVSELSIDKPAMFIIRREARRLAVWVKLEPKQ